MQVVVSVVPACFAYNGFSSFLSVKIDSDFAGVLGIKILQ